MDWRPDMFVKRSLVILLACASFALAADWPQWRGPNRAAVVPDFTAPATWPKALQKKWSTPVGGGVATPALVGDKLYAFAYQAGKEVIRCLDAGTGKELWKNEYEARAVSVVVPCRVYSNSCFG
jgi:outer membrane protein assembly factor BamB